MSNNGFSFLTLTVLGFCDKASEYGFSEAIREQTLLNSLVPIVLPFEEQERHLLGQGEQTNLK